MCCMRLAENTRRKNYAKIRHLHTIAQLCLPISSQLRHVLTIGKKRLVKQQYLLHICSQHGEVRSTNGWDQLASLWHPSKSQRVLRLGFVTAPTSLNGGQSNFARCLVISLAGTLYIIHWYTWGGLAPNGILPGAKFTLRPSLMFSYIGRVTAWHSSSNNFEHSEGGHHVILPPHSSLSYAISRLFLNCICWTK